jgi:hypothetical protein
MIAGSTVASGGAIVYARRRRAELAESEQLQPHTA